METTIFSAVTGSRLYGTDTPESDYDYVEVVMESLDQYVLRSARKGQQTIDKEQGTDVRKYGFSKFVSALSSGSPMATPMLWHPHPEVTKWPWWNLVDISEEFINKNTCNKFLKAARSSYRTFLEKPMHKPKDAAIAYRWANDVRMLVEDRYLTFPLSSDVIAEYMAILEGALTAPEIKLVVQSAIERSEKLVESSFLKENLDQERVDDLIVSVYREWWWHER